MFAIDMGRVGSQFCLHHSTPTRDIIEISNLAEACEDLRPALADNVTLRRFSSAVTRRRAV